MFVCKLGIGTSPSAIIHVDQLQGRDGGERRGDHEHRALAGGGRVADEAPRRMEPEDPPWTLGPLPGAEEAGGRLVDAPARQEVPAERGGGEVELGEGDCGN